jgi:hypothetical protein
LALITSSLMTSVMPANRRFRRGRSRCCCCCGSAMPVAIRRHRSTRCIARLKNSRTTSG